MPATFQVSNRVVYPSSQSELGILVCERRIRPPFAESSYIGRLCRIGAGIGIRTFAFAPWTWDRQDDTVKGWTWNDRLHRWESERRRLPPVVYDRAWPETEGEKLLYRQTLTAIRDSKRVAFLNNSLPHKGKVYDMLKQDTRLAPYLPPTAPYEGIASLASWLREHGHSAFLKPVAGSQGKRVMALARLPDGSVELSGRDDRNRPLKRSFGNEDEAIRKVDRWISARSYLMQPLLDLRSPSGEPFDLRVLMQKDRLGRWTRTGTAARIGSPASVTANLHGGGMAAPAESTLASLFGHRPAQEMMDAVNRLSSLIVTRLEQTFGRFAEIGLDYGIERSRKLWFLEANSKPGRAAMGSAGEGAFEAAAEHPLSYAKSILLRPPGRVIHEFDHL